MYLRTNRLLIRNFKEVDIEKMFPILSDREVMTYIEDVFDAKKTFDFYKKHAICDSPRVFAIEYLEYNEVIGHFIFGRYNKKSYEIGFILNKKYWNMGIASEIIENIIPYSKKKFINSLIIECDKKQEKTKHIALKYGFEFFCFDDNLIVYRLSL